MQSTDPFRDRGSSSARWRCPGAGFGERSGIGTPGQRSIDSARPARLLAMRARRDAQEQSDKRRDGLRHGELLSGGPGPNRAVRDRRAAQTSLPVFHAQAQSSREMSRTASWPAPAAGSQEEKIAQSSCRAIPPSGNPCRAILLMRASSRPRGAFETRGSSALRMRRRQPPKRTPSERGDKFLLDRRMRRVVYNYESSRPDGTGAARAPRWTRGDRLRHYARGSGRGKIFLFLCL